MWTPFVLAAVATVVILYLPGYLLMRAARVTRLLALAMAPVPAVVLYEVLGVAYDFCGVFSTWVNVFLPVLALGVVLLVASRLQAKKAGSAAVEFTGLLDAKTHGLHFSTTRIPFFWMCLVAYIVVGLIVGTFFCLHTYNAPNAYPEAYDLVHHIGSITAYLGSGNWSVLQSNLYYGDSIGIQPVSPDGFYPAAYYTICAMAAGFSGASAMVATNAANLMLVSIVYPISIFALLSFIFRKHPWAVFTGAFLTLVFAAFPWSLFTWGPLYPNLAAYCFMPLFIVCFLAMVAPGLTKRERLTFLLWGVGAGVCLMLTQPNAVFSAYVFLVPYYVYRVGKVASARASAKAAKSNAPAENARARARAKAANHPTATGFAAGCIVALVALAVWTALYFAPPLRGVVSYTWEAFAQPSEAFFDALTLKYRLVGCQPVLAVLVVLGIAASLRHREYAWISCAYGITVLIYGVGICDTGWLQHFAAGFWYTDTFRVGCMATVFATPLAALGAYWVGHGVCEWVAKHQTAPNARHPRRLGHAVVACLTVCGLAFAVTWFLEDWSEDNPQLPGYHIDALAFQTTVNQQAFKFTSHRAYNVRMQDFVRQVKQIVPEDALLLNEPNDGTAYAAVVDDLNVYYRYMRGYDEVTETTESRVIRGGLDDISTSKSVRDAVRKVGAEYLIVLRYGREARNPDDMVWSYEDGRIWHGIDGVHDDTPGFEVVLSDGNMRLYRITALD